MGITRDEVIALANAHYAGDDFEDDEERVFAFLVDATSAYVDMQGTQESRNTILACTLEAIGDNILYGDESPGSTIVEILVDSAATTYPDPSSAKVPLAKEGHWSGSAYVAAQWRDPALRQLDLETNTNRGTPRRYRRRLATHGILLRKTRNCDHQGTICEVCAPEWQEHRILLFDRTAGGRELARRMAEQAS